MVVKLYPVKLQPARFVTLKRFNVAITLTLQSDDQPFLLSACIIGKVQLSPCWRIEGGLVQTQIKKRKNRNVDS